MEVSDDIETSRTEDAPPATGTYHFLDVGGAKYGECMLVEFGDVRILIDGSHQQDFKGQQGYVSIPDQLAAILGPPPHDLALIVVTHCHADHIGCLPELYTKNIIKPRFALLTDPKLGFGRTAAEATPVADSGPAPVLAALLREEDVSDLDDADLQSFIDAVATIESRYATFVKALGDGGVDVSVHHGGPLKPELAALLAPTGITLLGPTEAQLLFCARQISTTNAEAEDAVVAGAVRDSGGIADAYRLLLAQDSDVARNARGNGMNCQSITFAFGPAGARVLLAGDMQFAEPGVDGMDGEIKALRQAVVAAGPYVLYKTTHHSSHNGQDDAFLDALGSPPLIVHSGGLRDESHPYPGVLKMLKARSGIRFARTDHNGAITARPNKPAAQALTISKGALNDFAPNVLPDAPEPVFSAGETAPSAAAVIPAAASAGAGPQIIIVNLPPGPIDLTVAGIDIQVRGAPPVRAAATPLPRSVAGGSSGAAPVLDLDAVAVGVAPGRSITKLLFVTDPDRLAANIGRKEASDALAGITAAGGELLTGSGPALVDSTCARLRANPDRDGIVLLGGYDVVPPGRRDVLGSELRATLGATRIRSDADQFWVWSDASYADLDVDALAEIPVSRIPDGRDATLFLNALAAKPLRFHERFGVHNLKRPFAIDVWNDVSGTSALEVCEFFGPSDVTPAATEAACHYYMLHGSEADGRSFVGETADPGGYPPGFDISKVPATFEGVVFSGCCWGALIVRGKAVTATAGVPAPRLAEESIALAYLKAGATALSA